MVFAYTASKPPIQYISLGERISCVICKRTTRNNKPWCPSHITESPYVQWILKQTNRQEQELREVHRSQSSIFIEDFSLTLQEIVAHLHHKGSKTIKGLSKELSLDPDTVKHYIDHLRGLDMVRIELNKRKNDKTVHLLSALIPV